MIAIQQEFIMHTPYKHCISYDYENDIEEKNKSLFDITLYDLGSIDHDVYLKQNKTFGFDIQITNQEEDVLYKQDGVHHYAVESIAVFCRHFLYYYESVLNQEQ